MKYLKIIIIFIFISVSVVSVNLILMIVSLFDVVPVKFYTIMGGSVLFLVIVISYLLFKLVDYIEGTVKKKMDKND